jgi:LacI family transcriptional regulator
LLCPLYAIARRPKFQGKPAECVSVSGSVATSAQFASDGGSLAPTYSNVVDMVTIRDVARHADVSVATVSRVINNTGKVSEELTHRVQKAILDLGFEPDFLARTWRTRITRTIAAVISDNTSPHHSIILREATVVALAHNYNLILCTTFHDPAIERRYLNMLRTRCVDGILLNSVGGCDDEVRQLTELGVPIVLLNRPLADDGPHVDAVVVDSYRGSLQVVEHLISQGHRRIAMVYSDLHESHKQARFQGYQDALAAHGIAVDSELVACVPDPFGGMDQTLDRLLTVSPRPTALFAASYNSALTGLRYLRAQGRQIPADIAFAMFDDVTWGDLIDPPLTVVRNPARELGRVAMELLFARMADGDRPPQEVRLQPELIVRRSSGRSDPLTTALPLVAIEEHSLPWPATVGRR